ncbi:hypothetical protein [Corynebacterium ulcerans]|uniref:hypothetical protein n=1 Tax=Corynebacterium ulcerans TaxID=65058 RepID=UPI000DFF6C37|nr:hypothetical protein [Corynebacterium ulcerans]STD70892.1 immunity-specific protein beta371 [Corynebacterium ulcerans]
METQIEAAQRRTEGDIFFERDITDSGTGRYRPGIDIKRGDIVNVLIWGRILPLPITRWEMISDGTASIGWRWHVGGAMIEDAEALRNHNDQLLQQIAQEKRQMAKTVTAVSDRADSAARAANEASSVAAGAQSTADVAQSTAARADEKADRAVVVAESQGKLAREAMQVAASSSAEAREATSRAMSADLASEEGKRIAIAANTTANQAQQTAIEANTRTNQIQQTAIEANERSIKAVGEVAAANAKANDAQQRAIEANSTALTLAPRFLHIDDGKPGFYGSSSGKLSTGAEFGSLEFRGTTFTKNSGAAFVSKAGWQGSILMICVATNGATDITATEITQAGQVHEMHAGGSFQAYRSATVVVLPVFSERKG